MQDLDFHEPREKTVPVHGSTDYARSKLAVVSLVFGILGLTVLPILGSLIAIVTGFASLGEIRASGGRLGGRAMAKAGLWLGFVWVLIGLVAVAVAALFVGVRYESHVNVPMMSPSTPARPHSSGIKMANELGSYDLNELKRLGVESEDEGGELICYYTNEETDDGEPESAALTSKQLVYMKGQRKTSFELKEIESLMDSTAYSQKYAPNSLDLTKYTIEVKRRSGARMRITIHPYKDGGLFYSALEEAWQAAGGTPAERKSAK
ncbi:MAG: DUF4190 domain-containing protein [Isosphaeraceae bacterium]|nr:DUF4190 domain-containing protein [Isosphaeraceae bacterium]